ncbi:MAG: flagellar motor protein MotB [Candidatus Omnitrophica bacterium]|nr:flagellar motor protein MotB [Candidatus Omnitrophota bacterium]MBU1869860.1 flagellar motor protein MotB [Candidatus Omnitrophota bacterium]
MKSNLFKTGLIIVCVIMLSGCTVIFQAGRRSDVQKIEELSAQLDELTQAKKLLEERLGQEIQDQQIKLQMKDKGLVITVVGDLLFDSGKAKIKTDAYPILDKVARILKENVPDLNVGIEGHTDNVPISHSGWKSNWELSSARALSVLHFLVEKEDVDPARLKAEGCGEYQPVASNDTKEGRKLNRRVEIVILPKIAKTKSLGQEAQVSEPVENLK